MSPVAERAAEVRAAELRAAVARALESPEPVVGRLVYAKTSVRLAVGESDGPGVTLELNGDKPALGHDQADTAIEIVLGPDDAGDVAIGRLSILQLIAAGRATARGPVRRFLEIDPMLRRLLGDGSEERALLTAQMPLPSDLLAIETRGLKKRFGPNVILDGLDVAIPEGVISVLLGPSGTGKSVLLKHITGLLDPDEGEVLVRGQSLAHMEKGAVAELRCDVGVMFQDGALFSNMNVYDNVAFPLREHTDLQDREVHEVVMQRLADVGLTGAVHRLPSALSGGMRKRAGLARALALEPGIVLVDEPDSGLDPVRTALLGELLVEQHSAHGGTMVVVTHNVPLARFISDHVSVLWKGKVVIDGMANDVFESDDPFVRQFIARATVGPLRMD
jgi:phospholipid/cholesterol/gamma-HCH transport system ATP-binding protein